ncbi:MAG: SPFH domain-containing protein, partial [Acidobacteriota bacterium]|nr:SPFH domain-containing protein [Acidobacteriota bacterium]
MEPGIIIGVAVAIVVIVFLAKAVLVVPQQNAYVVERLGKFQGSLRAGFHILVPFFDAVRYKHSLKERAVDIAEQICITRDNV